MDRTKLEADLAAAEAYAKPWLAQSAFWAGAIIGGGIGAFLVWVF